MNVNEIIMNKRIERGVSRKELAEGLGVSESTIYRIETNPNLNPNNKLVKILYLICDYPHKHYTFKHFEA